ncbi:YegP family protein [candidate division KSB1 bacterium]
MDAKEVTAGEAVAAARQAADKASKAVALADEKARKLLLGAGSLSGCRFEVFRDKKGEYRWRLRARNGRIVADSGEGYKRKSDCLHGIRLVSLVPADSTVKELA